MKSRTNPEELGVKIGGIRETRTKDLLIEVKCAAENRKRLNSAFHDMVGETGSVRYFVPRAEVEILDIDPILETEEITEEGTDPIGSAGKWSLVSVTTALVLDTWRRIAGGRIAGGVAENANRKDTTQGPAQRNHSATSAPPERRSPGPIISRVNALRSLPRSSPK